MLKETSLHLGNLNVIDLEDKIDKINDWLSDDKMLMLDLGVVSDNVFIKISLVDSTEVDYAFKEFTIDKFMNATEQECYDLIDELMYMTRNMIIESYKTNVNETFNALVREMI